ncbi:MAG: hypothetical protein A2557_05265 [Candidatus Lambdaproteobacteria bacterium RIFOXYD2_FULL_56_26]|uniref:Uncharacterized protein n=1 Tax=Candidatus Lambdaproteobacteria bacterium RIFOXYD2_FULL_56_26 TaxID=1817773 RepID=A0A1F6GVL2_9PROT|nr:MAG: hypothetical protein A2557_05265 [Candidatus Lambdaproteobacteria bacterium RIFOXYD2_FULL_56_26]
MTMSSRFYLCYASQDPNLFIVMVLGGLWHGAANHFVVWGAIHGLALIFERILKINGENKFLPVKLFWYFFTQCVVYITWIFFRAGDVPQAIQIVKNFQNPGVYLEEFTYPFVLLVPLFIIHIRALAFETTGFPKPGIYEKSLLSGLMLYFILSIQHIETSFIYFQF